MTVAVRTIQTPGSRALVWDQLVDLRGAGGLHRALGLVGAQAGGLNGSWQALSRAWIWGSGECSRFAAALWGDLAK